MRMQRNQTQPPRCQSELAADESENGKGVLEVKTVAGNGEGNDTKSEKMGQWSKKILGGRPNPRRFCEAQLTAGTELFVVYTCETRSPARGEEVLSFKRPSAARGRAGTLLSGNPICAAQRDEDADLDSNSTLKTPRHRLFVFVAILSIHFSCSCAFRNIAIAWRLAYRSAKKVIISARSIPAIVKPIVSA